MFFPGPQHPGRDGDGRHGPGDQHERNHHAGGCSEQDGEVWGKPDAARPLVCMTWSYLHTLRGIVYSMQACVYAAPCMPLSSDLVDAPYLLLSVCALSLGLSSCRCNALNSDPDFDIFSPVPLSRKDSIIAITFAITMQS